MARAVVVCIYDEEMGGEKGRDELNLAPVYICVPGATVSKACLGSGGYGLTWGGRHLCQPSGKRLARRKKHTRVMQKRR